MIKRPLPSLGRRVRLGVYAMTCLLLIIAVWGFLFPPRVSFVLKEVRQEAGFAYVAVIEPPKGLAAWFKFPRQYLTSELAVTENGALLSPGFTEKADIIAKGAGRYLHEGHELIFSASDNSDPRTNGRSYVATSPLHLTGDFLRVTILFSALAAFLVLRRNTVLATRVLWPGREIFTGGVGVALVVSAGLLAVLALITMWRVGMTASLGLGAFFPVSDAKGHYECAQQLIDFGQDANWCHRRPIYSVFLAGLSFLTARDLGLLHIAQAFLALGASAVFAREVGRWLGGAAGGLVFAALFMFCWTAVFGQTMTEAFGYPVGILGQALILRAAGIKSLRLSLLGIVLVSAALSARPGAVFVLVGLPLWLALWRWRDWRAMAAYFAVGAAAVASGFSLHSFCMMIVHADAGGSFGNFALTLYGLSVGGTWNSLLTAHPELAGEAAESYTAVYRLAFQNFLAHPDVLIKGLIYNFWYYISGWSGWIPLPRGWGAAAAFAASAALVSLRMRNSLRIGLLAVFLGGEVASAFLIARDAELRVWSATIGLSQIVPLIFALTLLMRRAFAPASPALPETGRVSRFEPAPLALLGVYAVCMLLTATGVVRTARVAPRAAPACASGLASYVVDFGKGAAALRVADARGPAASWAHEVTDNQLAAQMNKSYWYYPEVARLKDVTILQTSQVAKDGPWTAALFAPNNLVLPQGPAALCVDVHDTITVVSAPYARIVSARPLP